MTFLDQIKDIRGSTFDSTTGEPLDGKWLEIKNWYGELSIQDTTFNQYVQDAVDSASAALTSENNSKLSETNSKTSETNASNSEAASADSATLASKYAINAEDTFVINSDYSAYHFMKKAEKEKWIAEAYKKTAESYANAPVDTYVQEYTSNGDGTFTATVTNNYSALHYESKMQNLNINNIIAGSFPTVDPAIVGVLWNNNGVITLSQG